jgi:Bacterial regulatory helix-turn-helix protein, lysR family
MTRPARAEAPEPARLPSGLKHRRDGVEIFRKLGYRNAGTFEKIDMISEPGTPTLDQLKVFLTIVETGSFAAAARALNRATSVVSYAVANLEAQLGFPLFDRDSTRKPQLTRLVAACLPRREPCRTGSPAFARRRLAVHGGKPRHQCFGGVCEHRGVDRSRFHPVRAERRRSVGDQCHVISNPSAAASQNIALYRKFGGDVGRGGMRIIVSVAMRRAGVSPVLPIARIECCVSPATISNCETPVPAAGVSF